MSIQVDTMLGLAINITFELNFQSFINLDNWNSVDFRVGVALGS